MEVDDSNLINSSYGENWTILFVHKVLDWILFNGKNNIYYKYIIVV